MDLGRKYKVDIDLIKKTIQRCFVDKNISRNNTMTIFAEHPDYPGRVRLYVGIKPGVKVISYVDDCNIVFGLPVDFLKLVSVGDYPHVDCSGIEISASAGNDLNGVKDFRGIWLYHILIKEGNFRNMFMNGQYGITKKSRQKDPDMDVFDLKNYRYESLSCFKINNIVLRGT